MINMFLNKKSHQRNKLNGLNQEENASSKVNVKSPHCTGDVSLNIKTEIHPPPLESDCVL